MTLLARRFPTVLSTRLPHELAIDRAEPECDAQALRLGGLLTQVGQRTRPQSAASERSESLESRLCPLGLLDQVRERSDRLSHLRECRFAPLKAERPSPARRFFAALGLVVADEQGDPLGVRRGEAGRLDGLGTNRRKVAPR